MKQDWEILVKKALDETNVLDAVACSIELFRQQHGKMPTIAYCTPAMARAISIGLIRHCEIPASQAILFPAFVNHVPIMPSGDRKIRFITLIYHPEDLVVEM